MYNDNKGPKTGGGGYSGSFSVPPDQDECDSHPTERVQTPTHLTTSILFLICFTGVIQWTEPIMQCWNSEVNNAAAPWSDKVRQVVLPHCLESKREGVAGTFVVLVHDILQLLFLMLLMSRMINKDITLQKDKYAKIDTYPLLQPGIMGNGKLIVPLSDPANTVT